MNIAKTDLKDALHRVSNSKITILGDIILDHYVFGEVERISPEAPVPVLFVRKDKYLLGGAGNVANNIKQLNGNPLILSVCGNGENGKAIKRLLDSSHIEGILHIDCNRKTTLKTRFIAGSQQLLRVDQEHLDGISDELMNRIVNDAEKRSESKGVLVISDYGKGLISYNLMERVRKYANAHEKEIIVDPKVRNFHMYKEVDLLTPNIKEATEGIGYSGPKTIPDLMNVGRMIFEQLQCRNLLITLGKDGMLLFCFSGVEPSIWHIPAAAKDVFDVTGAGDTVVAVVSLMRSAGNDLLTACMIANYAAAYVVGQIGTSGVTLHDIETMIDGSGDTAPRQLT